MMSTDTEQIRNPKAFTPPKEHFIYRIRYTKGAEVRFIGHLDVMRLFQRANKRARLPLAYSQGFNPHQLLSFASPLTLGATSEGEYGDFEMAEKIEPAWIKERLNQQLPRGMQVTDVVLLTQNTPAAMAATSGATYHITMNNLVSYELLCENIPPFLNQSEIRVMKKTKRKEEEVDIRPEIYDMSCQISEEGKPMVYLFLAAGSIQNLKPEPVMRSLYQFMNQPFSPYQMHIHKLQLFRKEGDKLLSLTEGVGVRTLAALNGVEV